MKPWLYAGAGLALAIGLALAVTLRPRPVAQDATEVVPPPLQTSLTREPASQPAASAEQRQAVDAIPEYVLGKDWRRLAAAAAGPTTPIPPDPQTYYFSPDGHPPPIAADAASAAIEASALATADGGPPITLPVVDNEATPEATGDTRVDR